MKHVYWLVTACGLVFFPPVIGDDDHPIPI